MGINVDVVDEKRAVPKHSLYDTRIGFLRILVAPGRTPARTTHTKKSRSCLTLRKAWMSAYRMWEG